MAILIAVTFALVLFFLSQYSRYRLRVVEAISGKKQTLVDQFSLNDEVVNFEKYLTEHSSHIDTSKELKKLVHKAKIFYWLQGVGSGALVIEFILLVFWN